MDKLTDKELIKRFQEGDQLSFEELISRYSAKAFSLATRLTRNQEDAEEVLQDVFVTVFRKIDGFEGKSSFSSWLYRVTVNSALMKLRKRRQDQSIPMDEVLSQVANKASTRSTFFTEGEAGRTRAEISAALEEAIVSLPDEYRPVFVLRDIDGLSSKEVSEILDLSVPAVKSRLHRSRLMLRKKLAPFYQELTDQDPEDLDKLVSNG
jgi:RNA polymerase sigma-70 factor, ECF subfamily